MNRRNPFNPGCPSYRHGLPQSPHLPSANRLLTIHSVSGSNRRLYIFAVFAKLPNVRQLGLTDYERSG
jgi:hypothetical protein